jgi:hypothetical protein
VTRPTLRSLAVVLGILALGACVDELEAASAPVDGHAPALSAQLFDASVTTTLADAGVGCPPGQVLCGRCMEAFAPTASVLHTRIFTRSCALSGACHTGRAAQEGLSLASIDETLRTAVAQPSKQAPSRLLIAPGSPADSYLVDKLRGHAMAARSSTGSVSTRMPPPPSEPLCEAKIQAIEAWIAAGAPP